MPSMRWKIAMMVVGAACALSTPALAKKPSPTPAASANEIGALDVAEGEKGTTIRIKGTVVPTFSVFKLSDPPRLFVDISNSTLAGGDGEMRSVDNGVITQVAMIDVTDNGRAVTRVIVGFDRAAHYDVRTEGDDVVVFIDGEGRRAPSKADEKAAAAAAERAALQQERRKLEAERQRWERASKELATTKSRLQQAQQELTRLRTRLKDARGAERADIEAKIARKNEDLVDVKAERDAAVRRLDALKAERAEALRRAEEMERRAEEMERQAESAKRSAEEMERQAESAKRSVAETREELAETKRREIEAREQATTLKSDLQQVESRRTSLEQRLSETQQRAAHASNELTQQRRELDGARDRVAKLEAQLADMRRRASAGDKDAKRALSELERERDAKAKKAARMQRELDQAQSLAAQERAKTDALRERLQTRNDEIDRLKARIAKVEKERAQRIASKESLPAAKAVPVDPMAPNVVRDIRLETRDGRSRIVVELDRPGRFETMPGPDSRAVMILNDAELPDKLQRTLSADAQGGAVRFVSSFTDGASVRMEAELNGQVAETIRHDGNKLVWEFAPEQKAQGPRLAQAKEPKRSEEGEAFTSAPPLIVTDPTKVSRVPGMSRKRLTIDLRAADIQNVLRLIAKEGGVNIISGASVSGTVTMRLRSVPLEQVFLTILQSQGLGFEMRGNVIRVAPQKTLLEEQEARAEARRQAINVQPLEVFLVPVNYATANDLTGQVQGLLSGRGSVTVDERTNTLIIKDIPQNLESIRRLVESLDAQVPQVLIEARIVETSDNFQKQLGIQWGGNFGFSQANGNPTGLAFPSVLGVSGAATDGQTPTSGTSQNPNFAVNLPAPVGTGAGGGIGLTMGSAGGAVNLNLRLSALEEAGQARIISAPKILTLDNREATISQGTSIPISVVSAAGVQTVFVQAVLELTVTPHVTPDGNIQMSIEASKNEPDFQNTGARGDPTIIRRQAETELLIKDGDTTVIGGIYTRNSGSSISAVPFLHKIPILGFFFRTTSQSDDRAELLIFITPRIVNRAESLGTMSTGFIEGESAGGGGGGGGR